MIPGVLLRAAAAFAAAGALAAALAAPGPAASARVPEPPKCLKCHVGIEDMHPDPPVGCVECHGGEPNNWVTRAAKPEADIDRIGFVIDRNPRRRQGLLG